MSTWKPVTELCEYLEELSYELNQKLEKTKREASKLQDIYEAISPVQTTEKREPPLASRPVAKQKFFRGIEKKPEIHVSADPYGDFVDALNQYKTLPKFQRERLSNSFVNRIMDFSRITPAHLHERMIPCLKELCNELDGIMSLDINQMNQRFRAKYTMERAQEILDEYEKLINENGALRRVDVIAREKVIEPSKVPVKQQNVDSFETIANLTPRQLNEFYHLRGTARQLKTIATMREKTAATFVPFLKTFEPGFDDRERGNYIRAAARAFQLLTNSKRMHALVCTKY